MSADDAVDLLGVAGVGSMFLDSLLGHMIVNVAADHFPIHVINLDRTPGRFAEFMEFNGHLGDVVRFPGVDGQRLDVAALVRDGMIEPAIAKIYTPGALGIALSHFSMWDRVIATGRALTICEDDAIFNRHFYSSSRGAIEAAGDDWDIIVWAWNFDSALLMELMQGVSPCLALFGEKQMRGHTELFQSQVISPRAYRLLRSCGSACYSISPKGAKALKAECQPIRAMRVVIPGLTQALVNVGVDIMMANAYPGIGAWVSFPPLVISRNEGWKSTNWVY